MSAVGARSLDMSALVMVLVMVPVSMRIAYVFAFDIPCADVGVADFSTTIPLHNVCKMVYCIFFPAYVR